MKKILFISKWLNIGGTETFMMNVLRNINCQIFHIDFLIFSENTSAYSVEAEERGATIYRLPQRNSGLCYYRSLDKFFKEHASQYAAIHFCGGNLSSVAPIYYSYKYNIPIRIVHSHSVSSVGLLNKILHRVNKNLLPILATDYLACSFDSARYFFGKKKHTVIKNGINLDIYNYNAEKRAEIRERYNISDTTHLLGHIGRFDSNKNQVFLVNLFCKYREIHPDSRLMLVGTGVLEEEIKDKCRDLGIEDSVLFMGARNDIPELLNAMDCFVMPSIFEGLPFVLIEAQATGLPCVISDTVSEEAKLSPYVTFLDLNASLSNWAKHIYDQIDLCKREDGSHYINAAGFDIKHSMQCLEQLYGREQL